MASSGTAQPHRPPTLKDVARLAGVSVSTVSYVVSGRSNRRSGVPEPTRTKVLQAAEQVGYRRNRSARALRRDRSELVALVWNGPSDPWIDALSAGLEEVAEKRDYGVIHLPYRDTASGRRVAGLLRSGLVDGALLTSTQNLTAGELRALPPSGVEVVVHSETIRPNGFDVVRHGEREAMAQAIEHLLGQGLTNIRVLAQQQQVVGSGHRLAGALAALEQHGIGHEPVVSGHLREEMYDAARRLLLQSKPEAVIALNDRSAIATIWAAQTAGLSVPDDVAVIGVGNTRAGEVLSPSLSTVGDPSRDYGPVLERLFERVEHAGLPGKIIRRPWDLIVRESSTTTR